MNVGKTFYAKTRREWRAWLSKHHRTAPEIWLIYYKKQSGKPRIPYNHAVEEALCYGWIDSLLKPIDADRYAQWAIPNDILRRLKRDRTVWRNFQRLPATYQRIRIGWITAARHRPEVFGQRLRYFLKMTARNKRFGMVQ